MRSHAELVRDAMLIPPLTVRPPENVEVPAAVDTMAPLLLMAKIVEVARPVEELMEKRFKNVSVEEAKMVNLALGVVVPRPREMPVSYIDESLNDVCAAFQRGM